MLQELLASLCQRYAVRVTLEQLHAEALLQPLECGRNGRLRDVQVDRRLRDLTGLGGREDILDLLERKGQRASRASAAQRTNSRGINFIHRWQRMG